MKRLSKKDARLLTEATFDRERCPKLVLNLCNKSGVSNVAPVALACNRSASTYDTTVRSRHASANRRNDRSSMNLQQLVRKDPLSESG
jgi:hypothetical protein